jgi:hypothetical protein
MVHSYRTIRRMRYGSSLHGWSRQLFQNSSSEPTAHSRCCQTCSDPASGFSKILLCFEFSEKVSVIVKRCTASDFKAGAAGEMPRRELVNPGNDLAKIGRFQNTILCAGDWVCGPAKSSAGELP